MSRRFEQPENYRNRELSWLEFDYRVLSEAGTRVCRFLNG